MGVVIICVGVVKSKMGKKTKKLASSSSAPPASEEEESPASKKPKLDEEKAEAPTSPDKDDSKLAVSVIIFHFLIRCKGRNGPSREATVTGIGIQQSTTRSV